MSEIHKKYGELLKSERERKNLSIEDISEKLKISVANLESIENGTVEKLPSELYFDLFTKSYSETFGIDFERTMEAIKDDIENSLEKEEKAKKTKPSKDIETSEETSDKQPIFENNRLLKRLLYIFGGIIVVFIIFITVNKIFFTGDIPVGQSREDGNAQTPEENNQANTEEMASFDWDNTEYKKPEKIKLRLLPQDQSWATVVADGDTVIYRILNGGRIYDVEADYRIIVSVGIPPVVTTLLNGKAVNLANPNSGRISRVEINQMNLESFLNPETNQNNNPTDNKEDEINETSNAPSGDIKSTQTTAATMDSDINNVRSII